MVMRKATVISMMTTRMQGSTARAMVKCKTGKWRIAGDELCLAHGASEERCHQVWVAGNKIQLRQPGLTVTEDGILQKLQPRR